MVFEINEQGSLLLLHCSPLTFDPLTLSRREDPFFVPTEIQITGENPNDHHGAKHTGSSSVYSLRYVSHNDIRNSLGRRLEFLLRDRKTEVHQYYQFYDGISVIRCWTEVRNLSEEEIGIEYLSSFSLNGVDKDGILSAEKKIRIHYAHNSWCKELEWKSFSPEQLGLERKNGSSTKRFSLSNSGTWSTKEYLPMGCVENRELGTALMWQIESNGSWQWEIGDSSHLLYLKLSGPTESENHWWKKLKPGDSFLSVPVAVAVVKGDITCAVEALTHYRRLLVRPHPSMKTLPLIFNDYLHCLNADPSTEKLLPVIEAAAELGAEYFCIDAGWYADGDWWDTVGEWFPCKKRFPNGFDEVLEHIRGYHMIPGVWLEIEVIGINNPALSQFDDSCFFLRHGKRVIDHGRYQLDFRSPKVIAFADSVIDRLVKEYGVGYIKMDYNIDGGIGTERDADSIGDGLLEHNRAYLHWIEGVLTRYPELIIENCGSGGLRMDYAMLSIFPLQSLTDQADYREMAAIAAAFPTAVLPEQAGIWVYPTAEAEDKEIVVNAVNGMLGRFYVSGSVLTLSSRARALLYEGINCYKSIRTELVGAVPFWPLGLPKRGEPVYALGMRCEGKSYIAVWNMADEESSLFIPLYENAQLVRKRYPSGGDSAVVYNKNTMTTEVVLPAGSALLLEITYGSGEI